MVINTRLAGGRRNVGHPIAAGFWQMWAKREALRFF
jgi:hypothetical protein